MPTTQTATHDASGIFAGTGGTLIIEAESATPVGHWETARMDGEDVLLWDHTQSYYGSVQDSEKLTYGFTVDESGDYYLATHAGRDYAVMNNSDRYEGGDPANEERTDTGNDAYYGIYDVEAGEYIKVPTKLYTGLGGADEDLRWGTKFDDASGHHDAVVALEAGKEYRLEIVGRSDAYALDRITLNKDGFLRDAEIAESSLVEGAADAPPVDDSPGAPGPSDSAGSEGDGGSMFGFIGDFFSGIFDFFASIFGGGGDDDEDAVAAASVYDSKGVLGVELPMIEVEEDAPMDLEEDDVEVELF